MQPDFSTELSLIYTIYITGIDSLLRMGAAAFFLAPHSAQCGGRP